MANIIWALFSIANEYNQPGNNLEAWWYSKPSIKELSRFVGVDFAEAVFNGKGIRVGELSYRLEKIEQGRVNQKD